LAHRIVRDLDVVDRVVAFVARLRIPRGEVAPVDRVRPRARVANANVNSAGRIDRRARPPDVAKAVLTSRTPGRDERMPGLNAFVDVAITVAADEREQFFDDERAPHHDVVRLSRCEPEDELK